jgi:hypothetical protein
LTARLAAEKAQKEADEKAKQNRNPHTINTNQDEGVSETSLDEGDNDAANPSSLNDDEATNGHINSSETLNSSPGWWSVEEQCHFNMTWICHPYKAEIFACGLTGDLCKIKLDGDLSVVLKYYEEYNIVDSDEDSDDEDVKARRHIDNEVWIYTFLNKSSAGWPAHVPLLHYAGVFLSFRGIIISFVEGRVVKFSHMTQEQKSACEIALSDLHQHNVLHKDIHYKNFILNADNKAFIFDFGYSDECEDEELFEKEKKLLSGKLREGDNSVKQKVVRQKV